MCVFIRLRHGGDGWAFLPVFLISEDILSHSATEIVGNGTSLVGYIGFLISGCIVSADLVTLFSLGQLKTLLQQC